MLSFPAEIAVIFRDLVSQNEMVAERVVAQRRDDGMILMGVAHRVRQDDVGRGRPLDRLNELEYIRGEIWANIWHSDRIARISPETGQVTGWIDLSALYPASKRPNREHVLNGIAYDAEEKRIFVTGKNWPKLFEIEIVPR